MPEKPLALTLVAGQPCGQPPTSKRAPHVQIVTGRKDESAETPNSERGLALEMQEQSVGAGRVSQRLLNEFEPRCEMPEEWRLVGITHASELLPFLVEVDDNVCHIV